MNQPTLTDKELLELLEKAEEAPITLDLVMVERNSDLDSVEEFLKRFNLKSGDTAVRVKALFHIYKLYYQNNLSIYNFRYILKLLLNNAKYTPGRIYIDMNVSLLPKEAIIQASFIKPKKGTVLQASRKLDFYVQFIKRYNIKEGKRLISLSYLYNVYCLTVKHPHRYNIDDFMNVLHKSFRGRWMKGYKYFYLNVPKEGLLCREEAEKNSVN